MAALIALAACAGQPLEAQPPTAIPVAASPPPGPTAGLVTVDVADPATARAEFWAPVEPGEPTVIAQDGPCIAWVSAEPAEVHDVSAGRISLTAAGVDVVLRPVEEYSATTYLPKLLEDPPLGIPVDVGAEGEDVEPFDGVLLVPSSVPEWTFDGSFHWEPGGALVSLALWSSADPGLAISCELADDGGFAIPPSLAALLPSPDRPIVELSRELPSWVVLGDGSVVTLLGRAAVAGAVDLP